MQYIKNAIAKAYKHHHKLLAPWGAKLLSRTIAASILLNLGGLAIAGASRAADTVNFRFNIFEVSISVDDLENFAKTGEKRGALDVVSRYISENDMQTFRRILTERTDVPITLLSRFLYTSQGERSLDILGEFIKTGPNLSGNRAIRAAAVLATADKASGLSLLNFLRKFPTSDIYFDIQAGLQTVGELSDLLQDTQRIVQVVNQEATKQAQLGASDNPNPVSPIELANLGERGKFTWQRHSLSAPALNSRYEIPFYLFVPNVSNAPTAKLPTLVIYPGLISNRDPFLYLAEHLASYGFAVVLTISPNSSEEQLDRLINGLASEIAPPESFVERPNDITAVLNYLEKSSSTANSVQNKIPNFDKIDWQNVGMIGHSFGGYAALALVSDAKIQFDELSKACQDKYKWNASLLLQCVALDLPKQDYKLGDPRIRAAIALNPVTSHVLGQASLSKITVPVAIVSSSDDTFAPAVPEQIVPFTWLTTPDRYLVLLNRAGHTAAAAFVDSDRLNPEISRVLAGADPLASQNYLKTFSVAFFKTHLVKESSYAVYLTPAYFANISNPSTPASLLRSLDVAMLNRP